jgi:hypothetical protein
MCIQLRIVEEILLHSGCDEAKYHLALAQSPKVGTIVLGQIAPNRGLMICVEVGPLGVGLRPISASLEAVSGRGWGNDVNPSYPTPDACDTITFWGNTAPKTSPIPPHPRGRLGCRKF